MKASLILPFLGLAHSLSLNGLIGNPQRILQETPQGDFESPHREAPFHDTCPRDPPLSCSMDHSSVSADSCCYEATNGVFLLAQLWDYQPAIGANDTFTLHGLWCDKCEGGFNQYCHSGWTIQSAKSALESTESHELLAEMDEVWLGLGGDNEHLWNHEFNKHGTCMATVNPHCYSSEASKYQYVTDFFQTSMELWRELPTYQWLREAGLEPSEENGIQVSEAEYVLASKLGVEGSVALMCDRHNALSQVYYYFGLKGSVASGLFVPRKGVSRSSCRDGFKWLPKGSSGGGGGKRPPGGGKKGKKGYLKPSDQPGCIITNGHWYTSGTCATFRVRDAQFGGVELLSSKGPCDVKDGYLVCGRNVEPGQFTTENDGKEDVIVYGGEKFWSADEVPQGIKQVAIRPGGDGEEKFQLKFVSK